MTRHERLSALGFLRDGVGRMYEKQLDDRSLIVGHGFVTVHYDFQENKQMMVGFRHDEVPYGSDEEMEVAIIYQSLRPLPKRNWLE